MLEILFVRVVIWSYNKISGVPIQIGQLCPVFLLSLETVKELTCNFVDGQVGLSLFFFNTKRKTQPLVYPIGRRTRGLAIRIRYRNEHDPSGRRQEFSSSSYY
jgi:hypothetical protein